MHVITATLTREVCTAPQNGGAEATVDPICHVYTPVPTASPTPTNTPTASATATPTPTSTPTPSATFTPTPIPLPDLQVEFNSIRYNGQENCNDYPMEYPRPNEPNSGDRAKCWIHQTLLEWMEEFEFAAFSHRQMIELIVEGEYRSSIPVFDPTHLTWADEALARRFYDVTYGCGLDGCQITNDQLYMFLSTYQDPLNYTLDLTQAKLNVIRELAATSGYYQTQVNYLNAAVDRVFNPPLNDNWTAGVLQNQPYSWATRPDIPTAQAPTIRDRLSFCNQERFAYLIANTEDPTLANVFLV